MRITLSSTSDGDINGHKHFEKALIPLNLSISIPKYLKFSLVLRHWTKMLMCVRHTQTHTKVKRTVS